MDSAIVILVLGAAVMGLGSLALLIVRIASPKLRGMDWLSAAFAAGALGAALLLVGRHPVLAVLGADVSLLLSFIMLHMAVLRLVEDVSVPFWHGGVLLGIQIFVDILRLQGSGSTQARIVSLGILVAAQSFVTARVLWRLARARVRAPALFSAILLIAFGLFNLARSGAEAFLYSDRALNQQMGILAFSFFIMVALGLAFGFFWMTTTSLTENLEHMASTDPLTRLYNRRVFMRWCDRELLRTQRSGVPFSVLMLDLDHFKRVNDDFGHQAGDQVLCAAVEAMQDSVRGIDVLCRWGGEEFAVLLPNATVEATHLVAERIRENVERITPARAQIPQHVAPSFRLTVSIGAATYRDLDDDVGAMLRRADKALYGAKATGRNRVLLAS